ncbi:MAG TPA: thioredoxin domain-containing protein [Gemmatimonadales bacterium]|nr:thioredoxin domain-containing protein [Gemmatimonadales bacterium]
MAEAGRSLKPFYLLLGAIAVVGAVLIAVFGGGPSMPRLTASSDCQAPAPGAPAPKGVSLGPDSAKVEITEFSDFACPWCARFAILTEPDVRQRLIPTGRVKWRYMNFPLDVHPNSPVAHLAAACALEQGKFWEMHDALYMGQNDWAEERNPMRLILGYATRIGLNTDSLRACMAAKRPWPEIQAERCEGIRLGVNGTPTFFVNGHKLPDTSIPAFDDLVHIVDSITAATAARPAAGRKR